MPAAPVLTHAEVLEDPQILHNESIVEARHPIYGKYRRVRPPVHFSATPWVPTSAPSLYGEDSEEILDQLGLSSDEQAGLRDRGAVTR